MYTYMGIRDRVRGRCATRRQRMTFCLHFLPSCIPPPRYLQVVVLVVLVVWARGRGPLKCHGRLPLPQVLYMCVNSSHLMFKLDPPPVNMKDLHRLYKHTTTLHILVLATIVFFKSTTSQRFLFYIEVS